MDRIPYFEKMLKDKPDDAMGLLALANEYGKAGRTADEVAILQRYVLKNEDEGNAYQRLGDALVELERPDEAAQAYRKGIEQAGKYGHDGMADEMREAIRDTQ